MSVLDREALERSPLADLHAIASELSIDSYRLLRREQLVDAILARQEGADGDVDTALEAAEESRPTAPSPRRRRSRQERTAAEAEPAPQAPKATEPEAAGPPPDTVSDRVRFESLPATFPDEPFKLSADDPTVAAIESLTPIGKGSRVTIVGPARAGKTEALRRLAVALQGRDDIQLVLLLVGVRPEEISEWQSGPLQPVQALSFATPTSAQDRAVYGVIDEVRTIALNGGNAVVLLDTLDGLHDHAARRALATARKLLDGGSVTLIATSSEPLGGETTVVTLDPGLAGAARFPALDLRSSGTIRAELLVGQDGAERIARTRADATGG
jgi:transcription termination factor Rho